MEIDFLGDGEIDLRRIPERERNDSQGQGVGARDGIHEEINPTRRTINGRL